MIKVADVINPARKTPLCVEWARRISEEYFSQVRYLYKWHEGETSCLIFQINDGVRTECNGGKI